MLKYLTRFRKCNRGNVMVTAAIALPVLIGASGAALDYSTFVGQRTLLQAAADAASLASARELYLSGVGESRVRAVARSVVDAQLKTNDKFGGSSASTSSSIVEHGSAVSVSVSQSVGTRLMILSSMMSAEIKVNSVARIAGSGRICVIGLDTTASKTVYLQQDAKITAPDCSVYSDSDHPTGFVAIQHSHIDSELNCSAGGYDGRAANYSPKPLTDCPARGDPLAKRPEPHVGGCDFHDIVLRNETRHLYPGVYCGGLQVSANSQVTLNSGIYIIKDGPLVVTSNSSFTGENVGFFLKGDRSTFLFASNSKVNLTAPRDGDLAGLLFFEARDAPQLREHLIKSDDARTLLGTLYLPRGILRVHTNTKLADQSAYTAIVARRIHLSNKPNLYLNTDYGATDIPVPEGVGPVGGNVYLSK